MSPQTPDLWNWTTENQRAKMGPQTPDLGDHEACDSSFGSQGWSEAYPVTDLRKDWTGDGPWTQFVGRVGERVLHALQAHHIIFNGIA